MMTRTQVSLDAEMLARARRKAANLGISLAEYVRRLLAQDLAEDRPRGDPSAIFDLVDSGGSDIAAEGDEAIGEAVAAEHERKGGGR